eukprot:gene4347-4768_t
MNQPPDTPELIQELLKKKNWEDFLFRTPCVRSSYLWGIGVGALMAAHKLRVYRGNLRHALNASMLTFTLVTGVSFFTCAFELNSKYEAIRSAFRKQNILEERERFRGEKREPYSSGNGNGSGSNGSGEK